MTGCFIDSGLDHGIFLNFDISQGSAVPQLRCGEIISQGFVANLLVNLSVKEVWRSVNIWQSYGQYCSALFFLTYSVHVNFNFLFKEGPAYKYMSAYYTHDFTVFLYCWCVMFQINFVACQLFALALGFPYRTVLGPHRTSPKTRHLVQIIIGVPLAYFCFGRYLTTNDNCYNFLFSLYK